MPKTASLANTIWVLRGAWTPNLFYTHKRTLLARRQEEFLKEETLLLYSQHFLGFSLVTAKLLVLSLMQLYLTRMMIVVKHEVILKFKSMNY